MTVAGYNRFALLRRNHQTYYSLIVLQLLLVGKGNSHFKPKGVSYKVGALLYGPDRPDVADKPICVIIDLYSRKVVACNISKKHSTQLISSAFKMAYKNRKPSEGLIFHSDRGTQYTANSFRKLLRSCSVKQSFSPSGSPHHNAVMESFFSSMKKEELYRANYHSAKEFEERIQHYIEFYNNERPHSTLGYKTPNKHEHLFYKSSAGK